MRIAVGGSSRTARAPITEALRAGGDGKASIEGGTSKTNNGQATAVRIVVGGSSRTARAPITEALRAGEADHPTQTRSPGRHVSGTP